MGISPSSLQDGVVGTFRKIVNDKEITSGVVDNVEAIVNNKGVKKGMVKTGSETLDKSIAFKILVVSILFNAAINFATYSTLAKGEARAAAAANGTTTASDRKSKIDDDADDKSKTDDSDEKSNTTGEDDVTSTFAEDEIIKAYDSAKTSGVGETSSKCCCKLALNML